MIYPLMSLESYAVRISASFLDIEILPLLHILCLTYFYVMAVYACMVATLQLMFLQPVVSKEKFAMRIDNSGHG